MIKNESSGIGRRCRSGAGRKTVAGILSLAVWALALVSALPAKAAEVGPRVYRETCGACHDSGVAKAPRRGDKSRWSSLGREGQVRVTAHGWLGEGGMPARGGRPDLTLEEFAAAVADMAQASGLKWQAPDEPMRLRIDAEITKETQRRAAKGAKPAR
jgi:cytochrome c5